jgi:hypothetical protein
MAINETVEPMQNGFEDDDILMLTFTSGLTSIMIEFEVDGLLETHVVIEEVMMQLTISPFVGGYMNVWLLPPVLLPFTFH